jgi:hypothetical protein
MLQTAQAAEIRQRIGNEWRVLLYLLLVPVVATGSEMSRPVYTQG